MQPCGAYDFDPVPGDRVRDPLVTNDVPDTRSWACPLIPGVVVAPGMIRMSCSSGESGRV